MMSGLRPFLRLCFRRLGGPPDPHAVAGQPHVGCDDSSRSRGVVINSVLVPERDNPSVSMYACNPCVHAVQFQSTAHLQARCSTWLTLIPLLLSFSLCRHPPHCLSLVSSRPSYPSLTVLVGNWINCAINFKQSFKIFHFKSLFSQEFACEKGGLGASCLGLSIYYYLYKYIFTSDEQKYGSRKKYR